MGKKYLEKSAAVLSEADRMQAIMDWQLFCYEQERMLYGDHFVVLWKPGELLYGRPEISDWSSDQRWEQTKPICKDCDVWWDRKVTEDCFICGKSYPRIHVKSLARKVYDRERSVAVPTRTVMIPRFPQGMTPVQMVRSTHDADTVIEVQRIHNVPVTVWMDVWAEVDYRIDYNAYKFKLSVRHEGETYNSSAIFEAFELEGGYWTDKDIFDALIENVEVMIDDS